MSANPHSSDLAFRVARLLKAEPPWEVVGERLRNFELHLHGTQVELERGPISVEGYGVRLIHLKGDRLGAGFQASTDASPEGVATAARQAAVIARHADFPARSVDLPGAGAAAPEVPVVDPKLWVDPLGALRSYLDVLLGAFDGRRGVVPSFGSVKAHLSEVTITNSLGLHVAFSSTLVDLELAIKAFGGPEGAPPGEFWVNESSRRLDPERSASAVDDWCRHAQDVRRAVPPPSGELAVVLPTDVLAGILPPVVASRFTGSALLRKIAPKVGTVVGTERLTVRDEGSYPWSVGSAPYDDEGTPRAGHPLVQDGKVAGHLYDTLYASALEARSTGNAVRTAVGPTAGMRFAHAPGPGPSTVVVEPGDAGSTEELVAAAGEGVLVTQLGWAIPDPISSSFGGEIRIGYRIRGGKLAEPVRGGTVGGVVLAPPGAPSLLANLEGIGSQSTLWGGLAAPPVLVRPLTVAGA